MTAMWLKSAVPRAAKPGKANSITTAKAAANRAKLLFLIVAFPIAFPMRFSSDLELVPKVDADQVRVGLVRAVEEGGALTVSRALLEVQHEIGEGDDEPAVVIAVTEIHAGAVDVGQERYDHANRLGALG